MGESRVLRTYTVLPVSDIMRDTEWYRAVLGFETVYLHESSDPSEATNYAILVRDGVQVHLILDEPPPYRLEWTQAGRGYLYLIVSDVETLFAEVQATGAEIARGLETENWGARGFNLVDPSGNAIHVEEGASDGD